MKNLLKTISFTSYKLKPRGMYAILYGAYQGASVIYIESQSTIGEIAFFVASPPEPIFISRKEFKQSLKDRKIELMGILPKDVYDVVEANFIHERNKSGD